MNSQKQRHGTEDEIGDKNVLNRNRNLENECKQ